MKLMEQMPATDFVVGALVKAKAPKPFRDQLATSGIKIKKGKVIRGNTGR